jgi:hypothetical protein
MTSHFGCPARSWSENRSLAGHAAAAGGASAPPARAAGSGGCGQQFAGVWVDGLDGDLVAGAFEAADVVAGLAADVHALFVIAGAEVLVGGGGVREQGMEDGQDGVAGGDEGFLFGACA